MGACCAGCVPDQLFCLSQTMCVFCFSTVHTSVLQSVKRSRDRAGHALYCILLANCFSIIIVYAVTLGTLSCNVLQPSQHVTGEKDALQQQMSYAS